MKPKLFLFIGIILLVVIGIYLIFQSVSTDSFEIFGVALASCMCHHDDTIPPTGSILINSGAASTTTTAVTLTLSCADPGSGCFKMRFSNDGISFTPPQAFATSRPWTLTSGDGTKTVYVQYKDGANNWSGSFSDTIVLDTAPPNTIIDSGPPSPTNSTSASFAFRSTKLPSTFQCRLDGGAWGSCTSAKTYSSLSESSHTFQVRATDAAGNTDPTPAVYTWVVDRTPPNTAIISAPPDPSGSSSATFAFSSSEGGSTFQCRIDGAAWGSCGTPKSYSSLSDGPHTFEVRATDRAGNTDPTPAVYTWTVDTGPPDTIIDGTPPDPSGSTSASFAFHSTEAGSTFECKIDTGAWSPCTSPTPYTGLSQGSHTFQVKATDPAGNTDPSPASYTWLIDRTAPTITTFEINGIDHTGDPILIAVPSITVTWAAADNAGGSGINHSELWKAPYVAASCDGITKAGCAWSKVGGNIPWPTTSVSDTADPGRTWYGLHVVDEVGNCIHEGGGHCGGVPSDGDDPRPSLGPILVFVDDEPPIISFDSPSAGSVRSTNFDVQFDITDASPLANCRLLVSTTGGVPWFEKIDFTSDCTGVTSLLDHVETILASWCNMAGANNCGVRIEAEDILGNPGSAERLFTMNQPPTLTMPGAFSRTISEPPLFIDADPNDDGFLGPLTFLWEQTAGPVGGASFPTGVEDPLITFTDIGNYTFRLTINDGFFSVSGEVDVEVTHEPPVITFISANQSINFGLPSVTASVTGDATDDGFIAPLTYLWVQASGPSAVIVSDTSKTTDIILSSSGTYMFEFRAFDGDFWNDPASPWFTTVTVVNNPPDADAGPPSIDIDFGFPINLNGSGSTDDGLPDPFATLTPTWERVSGPGGYTIVSPGSFRTEVTVTQAGTHRFRLTVSDGELSDLDEIIVNYGAPDSYGLVPCGLGIDNPETPLDETRPCGVCHFLALVHNVVSFFMVPNSTNHGFAIVLLLGGMMTAVGGFLLLVGGLGRPALLLKGRQILIITFTALGITYGSWVALNFLFTIVGVATWTGLDNWWQIACA